MDDDRDPLKYNLELHGVIICVEETLLYLTLVCYVVSLLYVSVFVWANVSFHYLYSQDLLFTQQNHSNCDELRRLYVLHCLNHVIKYVCH